MTPLRLLWVGREKPRDPEAVLAKRYLERIQPFLKMEVKVIKPFTSSNEQQVRDREGERLMAQLGPRDFLVLLDERGKHLTSPQLADLIQTRRETAHAPITFVIGGAMGLADALRQRADFVLSLSKMTLPHALARVIVLEQIYRALSINAGHPYHHEG